jgi:hypothetical protein
MIGFLMACQSAGSHSGRLIAATDSAFLLRNGTAFYRDALYTGQLFSLYPGTTDTAFVREYRDGKEDGCWKEFYPGHRLTEIRYFKKGSKEGAYLAYWPNRQLRLRYHFQQDEYEGACEEWNAAGLLIREMHYSQGREAGSQKQFYDDGSIRSNYWMQDGRRYGLLGTKNCVNVSEKIWEQP